MVRVRGLVVGRVRSVFLAGLFSLGALLVGLAIGAPGAEARSYATGGSFGFYDGTPDDFLGQVNSDANQCRKGRLVKVFRELGRRDRLIGRARASSTGQWKVSRRSVARGRYYMLIPRKKFGPRGRHVCRAYKSSTLRFG